MITLRNLIVFFLVATGVSSNAEMDFQSGCKDLMQSNQCIEAIEACTVFANQGNPEAPGIHQQTARDFVILPETGAMGRAHGGRYLG